MPSKLSDLEALLEYLKRNRGFDFTGYKRATLERRISKRMQSINVGSFADYLDYLEVHPEEFSALFNTVLINVTGFFRDPSTWEFLAQNVLPDMLNRRRSELPLRVWSAGTASGEEAYTLAMLFAELVGPEAFRETVKIYATDVDEEALAKARQASYTEREVDDVPPTLLEKYFEPVEGRYLFRKDLRRHVIFGRHDLIQDAPISRVDLLVCRNTLMYFNAETQGRTLTRFQFALNDYGVLFLGRAETMLTQTGAFTPIDLKRRISGKLPGQNTSLRERLAGLQHGNGDSASAAGTAEPRLRDVVLDTGLTAQLVVDLRGMLVLANERARGLFGISPADMGHPLQDLKISYRPVELRSAIDRVFGERRPVIMRDIEWPSFTGDTRWLDVHVAPLADPTGGLLLGASVAFIDVSTTKRLQRDLEHANRELETAYEELQATNEELETTNEELETTNEELQSTVEELETTNEELQSTNEELETMNEELQSTNEELQTMNDELRMRSDELNHVNTFLESILTSFRGGVIVVDTELKVLVWNLGAEQLWGLREDEARGKNVLGQDIGFPTETLKQPIRACLGGAKEQLMFAVDAVNRRGRAIACQVTTTPLFTKAHEIRGAILLMEELQRTDGADGHAPAPKKSATKRDH